MLSSFLKRATSFFLSFSILFITPVMTVNAWEVNCIEGSNIVQENGIDADIYQLVSEYQNGTHVQDIESKELAEKAFNTFGLQEASNDNVNFIYDVNQVDSATYEATRIAFYTPLEQETQGEESNVIIFCRIVYEEKYFNDDPWPYIMLKKVKGGVVQNSDLHWCEHLYIRYMVAGDAYDASGNRKGWKGDETEYGDPIYAPEVGTTYSIQGPNDYYYNMGLPSSRVVGFVKGVISRRLGNSVELEVASPIEGI